MFRSLSRYSIFILSVVLFGCSTAKEFSKGTDQNSKKAVQRIKELYFKRDFALGQSEGKQAIRKHPKSVELQAWFLGNMARNGQASNAITKAQRLVENNPENPWSYFALALVSGSESGRKPSGLQAAKQALSMEPVHPDFLWLRARFIPDSRRAITFVDSVRGKVENPANLLVVKGTKLAGLVRDRSGNQQEILFKQAFAAFKKARQADPYCFDAWYLPAKYSWQRGASQKALRLYQKAVAKTTALAPHAEYWQVVLGMNQFDMRKRKKLVTRDMQWLEKQRPLTAEVMFSFTNYYRELNMPARTQEYEKKLLRQYPESIFAEEVLASRFRNYRSEHEEQIYKTPDPQIIGRYQELLWDFIEHPTHRNTRLLASAYRKLFRLYRQYPLMDEDELEKVARGMMQFDSFSPGTPAAEVAHVITKKTENFSLAQQVAELSVQKVNAPGRGHSESERSAGYDALGWVFWQKGKLDSAQKYLGKAYALNKDRVITYHMGKLYEKMGQQKRAEELFRKGYRIEGWGRNPNKKALKSLYAKTHGDLKGYSEYQSKLEFRKDTEDKIGVLNNWIENPKPIKPFKLQKLGGKAFSSNQLEGKIGVINFWGTWCGTCIKEMPAIQKLYDKYRQDPDVKIITMNNDPKVRTVRNWIADHSYEFPVLRAKKYVREVNIHAFPTTWFLNEEGEVAFVKIGLAENLVKSFSWRIEALKR